MTALTQNAHFLDFAKTPPMGWNSWDCFATTVTEEQTLAQAEVMASKLKKYGWQYIVVDIQWYEPGAESYNYRSDAKLVSDEYGRLLPAPNRFPSSADGKGFKPLADKIHAMGLKFGVHLMRGIPRQCVEQNTQIKGSRFHSNNIADTSSTCPWNPDMYGVDMSKPGAQDYYNSVFELFAQWGVDYVKVDDISRPYHDHEAEIEGVRNAIDHSGRPMVLSLSPGETPLDAADHVKTHANLWRISDDFWDNWHLLYDQFERCKNWAPVVGPGHWPDADMLPLGKIRFGEPTKFTPDEQKTMMNLWAVFRSPLMLGCDLTKLDGPTLALITNRDLLRINQSGLKPRQVSRENDLIVWTSESPTKGEHFVALFNASEKRANVTADLKSCGISKAAKATDIWTGEAQKVESQLSKELAPHASTLYVVKEN